MYTMKEACRETGMNYEALKFYCNEGLVPNVKCDANDHRVFDDRDIAWIRCLTCLKSCGMSIQEMKVYIELCMRGKESIPDRKVILERKRAELFQRIADLQASVDYIDAKQRFYDDVLAGKAEYFSNLISTDLPASLNAAE